jgi:hypothetical protein
VPIPADLDRSEEGSREPKLVLFEVRLDGEVVLRVKSSVVGAVEGRVSTLLAEGNKDVSSVVGDAVGRMRDRVIEDHAEEGFGNEIEAGLFGLSKEVVNMRRGGLVMEKVMTRGGEGDDQRRSFERLEQKQGIVFLTQYGRSQTP